MSTSTERAAITVVDARLEVWHQNSDRSNLGAVSAEDSPDDVIPVEDLEAVSISSRAGDVNDEVQIDVSRGAHDLRVGDRVEFTATIAAYSGAAYGEDYGKGYGGNLRYVDWTGRVQPTNEKIEDVQHGQISVDATDWPGGVLGERKVTAAWVDEDVGAIIRDIVRRTASEVDASGVPDLGVTTDQFMQSRDAWDAVVGLAAKGDVLVTQTGNRLEVTPIPSLDSEFVLDPRDYLLPFDTQTEDRIKNVVRVDSGVSRQLETDHGDVSGVERVTDTTRLTHRLRARKSEIHSVELYVERDPDSEDPLKIRLQADEAGAPVAVDDQNSDIVSASWEAENLPAEGWKTFFFPDHTLPDRDPWAIVEAGGEVGHDVGVHDPGDFAYRSYYPHPLNFEVTDTESIDEYGVREIAVEKDNLETISATRDAAYAELARRAWPQKTISFDALSPRVHTLEVGDVFTIENPDLATPGEYIVMELSRTFDASTVTLTTTVTATWRKGVLADVR